MLIQLILQYWGKISVQLKSFENNHRHAKTTKWRIVHDIDLIVPDINKYC